MTKETDAIGIKFLQLVCLVPLDRLRLQYQGLPYSEHTSDSEIRVDRYAS